MLKKSKVLDKAVILRRMQEYDAVGRDAFRDRYTDGRGSRDHVISYEGRRYDLKAVWAAAHSPPVKTRSAHTKDVTDALERLGFTCFPGGGAEAILRDVAELAVVEGEHRLRETIVFSRIPKLVALAKKHYGLQCAACDFDFGAFYGPISVDFAEVHHLNPLAALDERTVTRVEDVAVLCANCHRTVHRQDPPLTVAQLKKRIRVAVRVK